MKALLPAVALALVLAPSTTAGALARSGLYGTVMRGPISPTCVAEQPCDAPAAGVVLVFSRGGVVVARVRTHGNGSYRIRLAPGRYAVTGGRDLQPSAVRVLRGRFRRVEFSIDTGIR